MNDSLRLSQKWLFYLFNIYLFFHRLQRLKQMDQGRNASSQRTSRALLLSWTGICMDQTTTLWRYNCTAHNQHSYFSDIEMVDSPVQRSFTSIKEREDVLRASTNI